MKIVILLGFNLCVQNTILTVVQYLAQVAKIIPKIRKKKFEIGIYYSSSEIAKKIMSEEMT